MQKKMKMGQSVDKQFTMENLKAVKSGNAHEVDDVVWTTAGGIKAANYLLDDIETYFLKTK